MNPYRADIIAASEKLADDICRMRRESEDVVAPSQKQSFNV